MRKRNIAVLLLTVLLLTGLTGCAQRGDTSGVEIVAGTSERFSDEDIRGAMDAAMRAFHRGHSGCAMVRLAYNEAYQTCWLAGAGAEDDGGTIVLLASVYARDPGRRSGLTAGETYADWALRARAARQRLARGQQRILKNAARADAKRHPPLFSVRFTFPRRSECPAAQPDRCAGRRAGAGRGCGWG